MELYSITPWAHPDIHPSPVPLTVAFSLTLLLTFISVSTATLQQQAAILQLCAWVTSWKITPAHQIKVWRKAKHWFPTLISSLNLGSSLEFGSIIVRSSFSSVQAKRGNLGETHFRCALQQAHTRNGELMEKWQCLLTLWTRGCPMTQVSHRKSAQPHFPKPGLSPLTFPCSSPALCRMIQENPSPHVGTFIGTHQKNQWTTFLLLLSLNLTSNRRHLSQNAAPGKIQWA